MLCFVVYGSVGSWVKEGCDVQEDQLCCGIVFGVLGWGIDLVYGYWVVVDVEGYVYCSSVDNLLGDYCVCYVVFCDVMLGQGELLVIVVQVMQVMCLFDVGQCSVVYGVCIVLE